MVYLIYFYVIQHKEHRTLKVLGKQDGIDLNGISLIGPEHWLFLLMDALVNRRQWPNDNAQLNGH